MADMIPGFAVRRQVETSSQLRDWSGASHKQHSILLTQAEQPTAGRAMLVSQLVGASCCAFFGCSPSTPARNRRCSRRGFAAVQRDLGRSSLHRPRFDFAVLLETAPGLEEACLVEARAKLANAGETAAPVTISPQRVLCSLSNAAASLPDICKMHVPDRIGAVLGMATSRGELAQGLCTEPLPVPSSLAAWSQEELMALESSDKLGCLFAAVDDAGGSFDGASVAWEVVCRDSFDDPWTGERLLPSQAMTALKKAASFVFGDQQNRRGDESVLELEIKPMLGGVLLLGTFRHAVSAMPGWKMLPCLGMKPEVASAMAAAAETALREGATVLDPMCGTCMVLLAVAQYSGVPLKLVGTDQDTGQLCRAVQNFVVAGGPEALGGATSVPSHLYLACSEIGQLLGRAGTSQIADDLRLRAGGVDVVISDVPCGKRSLTPDRLPGVYRRLLHMSEKLLRRGGRLVLLSTEGDLLKKLTSTGPWQLTTEWAVKRGKNSVSSLLAWERC
eukprot:TRINITY_DN23561_c0_g1_i1.p1 TRINITY_DN23561_c0_g1~~TRINITY_DN23561_c0_g1_i1.p1  ORF type:complete len:504 (-),score=74.30 TRINITY_DN23561_c0_g1_i1:366-1877(-)